MPSVKILPHSYRGFAKGWFPKRVVFGGCSLDPKSRNEGTKRNDGPRKQGAEKLSTATAREQNRAETRTRAHSQKAPYNTNPPLLVEYENRVLRRNQLLVKQELGAFCNGANRIYHQCASLSCSEQPSCREVRTRCEFYFSVFSAESSECVVKFGVKFR